MSCNFGDENLFLTISIDPRSAYDTRALLYQLEHGKEMPPDHPYKKNTQRITDLMSRFAPQLSIYLCWKTKMFLHALLCDTKQLAGDWMKRAKVAEGYYWARDTWTAALAHLSKAAKYTGYNVQAQQETGDVGYSRQQILSAAIEAGRVCRFLQPPQLLVYSVSSTDSVAVQS